MRKIEVVGFKRETLGTKSAKDLRNASLVPCVLYGGQDVVHFAVPMILFRDLIYTPEVAEVELNIEGEIRRAILQDSQFHPVNETILNVDFLEIVDGKAIKVDVPVKIVGNAPGVQKGGKMVQKLRKVTLKGLAENIPDFVEADITGLDLGQTIKVSKLKVEGVSILNNPTNPVATIDIPRALRGKINS
ncbi:50S ribosomal protein L25/general stress protein Ctc [Flectobacillus longus]|uniref:50S ribosomal protein L25/general stress protein Ctc n=1 Tax=Flectobacillus longus TaxID=2984207 RepID=UPI0024B79066|nr:50S ribosomal protein L25/general stress protein Ctc [Flectobacillus longus]MDI9882098.1 50S ribosomal protein L25/general stress protein Ctc [Flectobacillus longus]